MDDIMARLDQVPKKFSDGDFLSNKGMSNEVGIYVFQYDPKDEMIVRSYFAGLKVREGMPFRLVECDLYKIFLAICEEKHILKSIPTMEERRGREYLATQLERVATPEAFVAKMTYEPQLPGDILLITGVGKVYPFMRAHNILDNIQHVFENIPVVILYPGEFNGQTLNLFKMFFDGNYYRAFNLL